MRTLAAAGLFFLAATAAQAQTETFTPQAGDLTLRVGAAGVLFDSKADFTLVGQPVPGASLKASDNLTVAGELDYYLSPEVSLSVTVGIPPVTKADGLGVLAPVGRLGSVRYGTGAALVKYHLTGLGRFQPWIGGGATYMAIFSEKDAAIANLNVDGHWGGVLQLGAEYMLAQRWGVYASASRMFLHTNGAGTFNTLPITAKIDLDPTIVQGGLSFRF